ncbi:MAG TPA: methyltransferase [Micromonospora sp.]|nr:methyltransferase [Micromonospora sp.]
MTSTPENPHQRLHEMADLLAPSVVRAAAALRLADHIAAGVTRAEDLAARTDTVPELLDMLLRHLVALEILERTPDGEHKLTPLGEAMRDDDPMGLRQAISTDGLFGHSELALVNILHTVRTGEPCHAAVFGVGFWESVNTEPEFVEPLEQNARNPLAWNAELILDSYDWSKVRSVTDVGGHSGTLLIELLRRHPHLHGVLLDLKNVAEIGDRRIAEAGLADRAQAVVGSFFDPLPTGTDVYLLSAILADWSDEQAVAILRRCGEAAGPDGRVLLAEVNLPVINAGSVESARMELYLRAMMPKPVRTVDELKKLGAAAGLRVTWEGPVTPVRSILEFARQER